MPRHQRRRESHHGDGGRSAQGVVHDVFSLLTIAIENCHHYHHRHAQAEDAAHIKTFHHALPERQAAQYRPRPNAPTGLAQTVENCRQAQTRARRAERHARQSPSSVREQITIKRQCKPA